MRRYSPGYYSPPRREYGGRGRSPPRGGYSPPRRGYSPPRRGHGGDGYGRRKEQGNGSLLVRNIPLDCRPEELRVPFERFGMVRDVYIPKDYYTGEPRGFAFVQFVDSYDASQAQYHMNRQIFAGREISVVVAADTRKRPEEMRRKTRLRGPPRHGGRRSPYDRRSRSCSVSRSRSRSRSPRHHSGSGAGYRSRSYSPSPRQRNDADRRRSSKDSPRDRDGNRSYSPGYDAADGRDAANGKSKYSSKDARDHRKSSPRSPSRSRSRSAPRDASPARSG